MILGITARIDNDKYFVKKRYLDYFKDFDVVLIYLNNITCACAHCDAFVVCGGGDANPILYDEYNHNSVDICDEIDELDLKVIKYAIEHQKPLMGICRGMQIVNIYYGGSLKQNIFNHSNTTHKILLVDNKINFPDSFIVNSYHHQSIKKIGDGLDPIYYSIDGELEMCIDRKNSVITTQFHPEIDVNSEVSKLVLEYFKGLIIARKNEEKDVIHSI